MNAQPDEAVGIRPPLDDVSDFVDSIIFADRERKDAMTLLFAVSHGLEAFNTVPRMLVTSETKKCGKTTVLDAADYLCNNSWWSDPTSFAIRAVFNGAERPTPIFDEISLIYGENGLKGFGRPEYKIMIEGYRRKATLSMSVDRAVVKVPSYCVTICAGIGKSAPDALRDRSIIIKMRAKPISVKLEDSLDAGIEARGRAYGEKLHAWVRLMVEPEEEGQESKLTILARESAKYHPKLDSRLHQIWGPLFAIAYAAGGTWPERCLRSFRALALDANDRPVLAPEEQILLDALGCLRENVEMPRYLTSSELLAYIRMLDNKVYMAQTDRQMAMMMSKGLGKPKVVNHFGHSAKGWIARNVVVRGEELERIITPEVVAPEPDEYDGFFDEAKVTETTLPTVPAAGNPAA